MTNSIEFVFDNSIIIISVIYTLSTVVFLTICVCCRRNAQKNDFLGVDGRVKIKNPDENVNHLPAVGKYEFIPEFDDKRATTGSNPHRSLPDIPVYLDGENGASGDTCSDLYATVDDKKGVIPNGIPSSSRSEENPYDRLKKENPYAKVNVENDEPIAGSSIEQVDEDVVEIQAAVAVAGRVAASHDLPYMTPPIDPPDPQPEDNNIGPHFSGDSQDSSKGYTSISVREPLSHIRKQKVERSDPHYATVSDDSDDNMYAAIVEPSNENQIYNGSESETYAQIQPVTIVEVHPNVPTTPEPTVPDLPNVSNMKHVPVHSRQASSSSCTSSIANIGSPKPEKRQANSPLPPTPPAISTHDVSTNHKRSESVGAAKNLEDMYAKVQKNKSKKHSEIDDDQNRSHTPDTKTQAKVRLENRQSWSSQISHDEITSSKRFDFIEISSDSDSEVRNRTIEEHCYETLNKNKKIALKKIETDIGYERIGDKKEDPGYEQLSLSRISSETDPNYEILRPKDNDGYSSIKVDEKSQPTYSVVNKKGKTKLEPGYEEVASGNFDEPNYESISNQKSTESESDPNYESVKYLDVHLNEPPYEKLENNSDLSEYEQISSSKKSENLPDYEKINSKSSQSTDNSEIGTFSSDNGNGKSGDDHFDNNVEEIIQKNNEENMYFQI